MADLDFRAGLSRKEVSLSRRLYTHVRARLRLIEILFRRLLVLMAASIELPAKTPPPQSEPAQGPEAAGASPGESASTETGPALRRPRPRGFALMLTLRPFTPLDIGVFAPEGGEPAGRGRRPLAIARLVHRWRTLHALLLHPEETARRMARLLARRRAEGAARPLCLADVETRRLPAELGLIAISLPGLIAAAFRGWYDTG